MPENDGGSGFWQITPREGREDAGMLVADHLLALRHVPYDELRRRADLPAAVEDVEALDGRRFRRRTAITRSGAGDAERLRILIAVGDKRARSLLDPLAEELVIATPDGEFTRESTRASQSGGELRRYAGLSPRVMAIAAALALVALVAWLLLT